MGLTHVGSQKLEKGRAGEGQRFGIGKLGKERTIVYGIKSLHLTHKAVYLVHLIQRGLRPAFFGYHRLDFLAEGFDIFRMRKETIQQSCDRLKINNHQHCVVENKVLSLACEVVWTAAKLTVSSRRARPSRDLSTPLASLISHMSRSFCDTVV
jgi:hypothetical protein